MNPSRPFDHAEAQAVVRVRRLEPAAVRRPALKLFVVPRALTYDPDGARLCSCWICHAFARIAPVPVVTPLPYISAHVVQAEGIGGVCAHGCRAPDLHVIIRLAAVDCPVDRSVYILFSSTGRIFPFSFRRKIKAVILGKGLRPVP